MSRRVRLPTRRFKPAPSRNLLGTLSKLTLVRALIQTLGFEMIYRIIVFITYCGIGMGVSYSYLWGLNRSSTSGESCAHVQNVCSCSSLGARQLCHAASESYQFHG